MQIIRVGMVNAPNKRTKGCEKAPSIILNTLRDMQKSTEDGKYIEFEKLNLEEIHVNINNAEEANYLIYENSK